MKVARIFPLLRGKSVPPEQWTRTQRIRTAARLEVAVDLVERLPTPVYQQIAGKAGHLRELGMSYKAIAQALDVDDKTVAKAVDWWDSSVADRL